MKYLVLGLVLIGILSIGCVQAYPVAPAVPPVAPQPSAPNDASQTPEAIKEVTSETSQEPPADRTWLSPGKVNISNYYPGARAEYNITVHNGNSLPAKFAVTYREPSYVAPGYEKPPVGAQDWVIVADPTPVLAPRETRDILVVLEMPKDVTNYPMKWEFWISVMDNSQAGTVTTELCSRWLVSMR
ncbi:hypothetical protein MUP46_01015 [Patescibacteria group bacterium]|nr:hypothetical protein [Patescibacteria group bacterium]